ncbi:MAG: LytTR family transcriptional regulator [Candidatus Azobacteroides sp.]|nr:LytTR family transcriptional regulator [Candidatus Azobacteroides sp.]
MELKHVSLKYLIIAVGISGIFYAVQIPLLQDTAIVFTEAVISGISIAALLFFLEIIWKYSRFHHFPYLQKLFVYIALAFLFVFCWFISECFFLYIFLPADFLWKDFYPFLPLRLFILLLLYMLSLSFFRKEPKENIPEVDAEAQEKKRNSQIKEAYSVKDPDLERIAVKNGTQVDIIPVTEIIYLQAEGDYVRIVSSKGKFLKEQTMKSFENTLPPEKFIRIHRSYIVNVEFISQIELYNKQTQLLRLKDNTTLKVSSNGYKALKVALQL